jgi:tetratricopeptide (TPR) repeat protein
MSSEDSIVFERRYEEWISSLPRYLVVTDYQIERIIRAQLEAADRIIISQDRINKEVSRLSSLSEEILYTIDWRLSELSWQLEMQTETLKRILKVLEAPLGTQAKELRRRAERAYANGWIDDALEDFLESEKRNRYDFTVHLSLGNIYLFHKREPEKALEYYGKAAKYAESYSPYHAAFALLHIGLIRYLQGDFQKAYEATSKALKIFPNFFEAHYQHAQYCAILGKHDEAIEHLKMAIRGDRHYCVRADLEKDFDALRDRLRSFLEEWREKSRNWAKSRVGKIQGLIQAAKSHGILVDSSDEANKFKDAMRELVEAKALLEKGSLFDCWDACYKVYVAERSAMESFIRFLSTKISRIDQAYKTRLEKCDDNAYGFLLWSILLTPLISLILLSASYPPINWNRFELVFFYLELVFFVCLGFTFTTFMSLKLLKRKYYDRYKSEKAPLESALSRVRTELVRSEEESKKIDLEVFGDFLRYYTKEEIEELLKRTRKGR